MATGPEIKTTLTVDSSQFSAGLNGAEGKMSRFLSGLSGMGGGFRGLDALNDALTASGGSFSKFAKSAGSAGLVGGALVTIGMSLKVANEAMKELNEGFDEMGRKGKDSEIFGTGLLNTVKKWAWMSAIGNLFPGLMPEVDPNAKATIDERKRASRISAASASLKGPSVEERVNRWLYEQEQGGRKVDANTIAARLRMEQGKDAADKARASGFPNDQYYRIGLGTKYGGSMQYAQDTARNTQQTAQTVGELLGVMRAVFANPQFVGAR